MIHEVLELNQILILWNVNGWREMDSHLERKFGFLFELLVCNSLGEWDFLLSFPFFLENNPLSFADMTFRTLEFHDEKTLCGMTGYIVKTLGCMTAGGWCLAVDVNPGMGG